MLLRLAISLVVAPVVLMAASPTDASALTLDTASTEVGWTGVHVVGAAGGFVKLSETRAGIPMEFATLPVSDIGTVDLPRAVAWRCDARTREISVTDGLGAGASATFTTPSCKGRLAVKVGPPKLRAGGRTVVSIRDRWLLGDVPATVCKVPAGGLGKTCERVALAKRGALRKRSLRLASVGRWTITVKLPGSFSRRPVKVTPRRGRLRVLATGDSMIQLVDEFLKQRLRRLEPIKLRSDAHISTGISKPQMLNWVRHAAGSARGFKPDVTVVFIGANDGFNMPTPGGGLATCCGAAWVEEYARRTLSMMRSYERRGAGQVYWLLLPAPRSGAWRSIFRHVNAAIRIAAKESRATHVIDLRRVFTPSGRFRQHIRWHRRSVSVRESDGIHLNVAGSRIAAEVVTRRLRRDGVAIR